MFEQGIATRSELRAAGLTDRQLASAVDEGRLVRVRRGFYARHDADETVIRAVRIGGQLACVSALRLAGVFGFDTDLHVHLPHSASRLRPADARQHWAPLLDPGGGYVVGLQDALAQSVRCQAPWHAVASLDSALHQRLVSQADIGDVFRGLPQKYHGLMQLIDGRSEAGQETVLRLALRAAGLRVEVQVTFEGVGRVDLVVEGCLVIEADSRTAHDGWALHVRDRDRDIELARRGLMSLRPGYARTMFATADVVDAALALLRRRRRRR